MDTQKLIMSEIGKTVKKLKGVTMAVEYNFANQGTAYLRRGLKTVATFTFSFQGSYATFAVGRGAEIKHYMTCAPGEGFYIPYNQLEKVTGLRVAIGGAVGR